MRLALLVYSAFFLSGGVAVGQVPPNSVVGGGYSFPAPVNVAPGQVLTFFVQGVGRGLAGPVLAPAGDLPMSLAGISATLRQGANIPVPVMGVRPISTCITTSVSSPCSGAGLTAITVQMPYDMVGYCGPSCGFGPVYALAPAYVWFSEGEIAGAMVEVVPFASHVHILTACDSIFASPARLPWQRSLVNTSLPCPPLVTHTDASLVSAQNPARPGEELTIYATGMGVTDPAVRTGKVVRSAAPTKWPFILDFNFHTDAGPSKPASTPLPSGERIPSYVGLTPGFVGLYQVNFTVPQVPVDLLPCSPPIALGPIFQSNLTVSVGGYAISESYDGAGICVMTGGPAR